MLTLIKYEFKKLAMSKINAIAMLVGILLFTASMYSMDMGFGTDENGIPLYGKEATQAASESAKPYIGPVTNESIAQIIEEYQERFQVSDVSKYGDFRDPDHPEYEFARKNKAYTKFVFGFLNMGGKDILEIDLDSNPDFYQMYRDAYKINYLDKIDFWVPLEKTDREMQYWIEKSNQIQNINFDNAYVWDVLYENIWEIMMISFVVVLLVSKTYTREYKCKTDAILLTTKYGKSKLLHAKNIASFLYVFGYFIFCMLWEYGVHFMRYGCEGMNASVQVVRPACVFDVTVFQMSLIMFAAAFSVIFFVYAVAVFVSARMKMVLPVCGVGLVLHYLANMYVLNFSHGDFKNHLACLLPNLFIQMGIARPVSFDIFGMVFNLYQVGITVYMLLGFVLLFFAGKGFKVRHE